MVNIMKDISCTLGRLKAEVIDMCRRKGWGADGIQNPQHVAMAMLVEAMELLEHFIGDIHADEIVDVAEELADVMMYALQLMYTLGVDISRNIDAEFSDSRTVVAELRAFAGAGAGSSARQAMRVGVKARFVLEIFQWMNDQQVRTLTEGGFPEKRAEAGRAFGGMLREILILSNMLDIDIAAAISRKIAIVDRRVYPDDDPVR